MPIFFKKGFKYQLSEEYVILTGIIPKYELAQGFLVIDCVGRLTIMKGYAWDGPSGPAIDTKSFMRASLVHDALYQLMRQGVLKQHFRKAVDLKMREIAREDGMSAIRAWFVYHGVRWGAAVAAKPRSAKQIFSAP